MDLVQHAVPPRAREEVREHRHQPLHGGADAAAFLVVLALGLIRPVDQERPALDVVARQEAPVAAVLRVVAVVPMTKYWFGGTVTGP